MLPPWARAAAQQVAVMAQVVCATHLIGKYVGDITLVRIFWVWLIK